MGNTHCLVDRGRCPPCLVYSKSNNVDFAWMHLCAEYSNFTTVTPNGLLDKTRLRGVLKIQTPRC